MDEELRKLERDDPQSQKYFTALLRSGKACLDYAVVGGDSLSQAVERMNEQCKTPDYCLHPRELVGGKEMMRPLTLSESIETSLSDCLETDHYMTSTALMRRDGSKRVKVVQCYSGSYGCSDKPFEEYEGVELDLDNGVNLSTVNDMRAHMLWRALIPDDAIRDRLAVFIDKKIRFSSKAFFMPTIPESGVSHIRLAFGRLHYAMCSPSSQGGTLLIRKLRRASGAWYYPLKPEPEY